MIIDGKSVAEEILQELQREISLLQGRSPTLAAVLVGDHPSSRLYVNKKMQACERIGIHSIKRHFPTHVTENELLKEIDRLNAHPEIDGILVQLPLPKEINTGRVARWITPEKDVDGFHPLNVGKMLMGEKDGFVPCTALGIKILLERFHVDLEGKHVVLLGRSNIVGKPMASLLLQDHPGSNPTLTVLQKHTPNIQEHCLRADVLIVAIGQPKFITAAMVKEGVVIIDVGINKIEDWTKERSLIVGDVDFDAVRSKCSLITPVPGGVGPMTIAMLLKNTLSAYKMRTS
jgi:methylenetetrahydrofolate dehydrogenase (NADP+) / methenyltetrahydrofolate cyclohydrolase